MVTDFKATNRCPPMGTIKSKLNEYPLRITDLKETHPELFSKAYAAEQPITEEVAKYELMRTVHVPLRQSHSLYKKEVEYEKMMRFGCRDERFLQDDNILSGGNRRQASKRSRLALQEELCPAEPARPNQRFAALLAKCGLLAELLSDVGLDIQKNGIAVRCSQYILS